MNQDTWAGSLLWGRVGAAVLVLLSVVLNQLGVEFGAEDQKAMFNTISTIMASVGGVLAILSKWKEQFKAKVANKGAGTAYLAGKGQSGKATIIVMAIICLVVSVGLMAGCVKEQTVNPTIGKIEISPEKASFAGMTFAMIAPEQAKRFAKPCDIIVTFTTKEKLKEYLLDMVSKDYFRNMTLEQARITKDFIWSLCRDVGINIDFDLGIVEYVDGFDMGNAKDIARAACAGIKAGLANA